ncbi:hypothetical protein PoB_000304200 [Plakobranchus ocellatus]|uniref:Uncharacterized protein n=1 Tax=Plakobranchus ocellatus TaxID=259542 RepID=A0AAV3Y383_9GAST|nr:hypothetical protein PoB_000304200 [Plakobranchus ocellatus]
MGCCGLRQTHEQEESQLLARDGEPVFCMCQRCPPFDDLRLNMLVGRNAAGGIRTRDKWGLHMSERFR